MAEEQTKGVFGPGESGAEQALTPIHRRIHCGATHDTTIDQNGNELDQIAIDHFLDTLSEVAMAIVRRSEQLNQ